MHIWAVYGFLTIFAVLLSVYGSDGRRSDDTPLIASITLLAMWVCSNLSHWFIPHPYTQLIPTLDSLVAVSMAIGWRYRLRPWSVILVGLLLIDCVIHANFYSVGDWSFPARYAYDLKLNIVYIAQLLCVSFNGIKRSCISGWMSSFVVP